MLASLSVPPLTPDEVTEYIGLMSLMRGLLDRAGSDPVVWLEVRASFMRARGRVDELSWKSDA